MSKITGTVIHIGNLEVVSEKFRKQIFVIETDDKYPQKVKLETHQDFTDNLVSMRNGDKVICDIEIQGREYTSKAGITDWFNTLKCWRVEYLNRQQAPPPQKQSAPATNETDFAPDDDLPF